MNCLKFSKSKGNNSLKNTKENLINWIFSWCIYILNFSWICVPVAEIMNVNWILTEWQKRVTLYALDILWWGIRLKLQTDKWETNLSWDLKILPFFKADRRRSKSCKKTRHQCRLIQTTQEYFFCGSNTTCYLYILFQAHKDACAASLFFWIKNSELGQKNLVSTTSD